MFPGATPQCALSLLAGAVVTAVHCLWYILLTDRSVQTQWVYVSLRRLRLRKKNLLFLLLFAKLVVSRQIYTPAALWVRDPTSEPMILPELPVLHTKDS